MKRLSTIPSVLTVVLLTCSAPAHAQFYVGGGYGHTFARRAAPGFTPNIAFFIESESLEEPLGVRFEGNETLSIFFFTMNVTYAFGSRDAQFRPYLIGGFGGAIGYFELGYTLNAGGGLRFRYPNSKLALFTETRVFHLVKVNESRHTIAPVTVGVRLGF